VIVPPHPGTLSAFGFLAADVRMDYAASELQRTDGAGTAEAVARIYADLERQAMADVRSEGRLDAARLSTSRSVDMRYAGQAYDVSVPVPAGPVTPAADLRERLELGGRPVVLCLSAKRPHKNLVGLLDALAIMPAERRPVAVLPGYATPHEAELRAHAAAVGVAGDVRWLGWLDEPDVEGLFALAGAVVFPSFYEGFGLPVLEAMARGVPVACSDRASLPEVAGGAALLFDPGYPAQIAAAIERLLRDPGEAERLRTAGRARAARFTWTRTADLTLASYERALAA
jgi:glycosyltransferase involved in cell wall biosynthesis